MAHNVKPGSLKRLVRDSQGTIPIALQLNDLRSAEANSVSRTSSFVHDTQDTLKCVFSSHLTEKALKLEKYSIIKITKGDVQTIGKEAENSLRYIVVIQEYELIAPSDEIICVRLPPIMRAAGDDTKAIQQPLVTRPMVIPPQSRPEPIARQAVIQPMNGPPEGSYAITPSMQSTGYAMIAGINPYSPRWTIKGRCTQKSAIRTWSNARGEGKLFNFTVADESGEIRVTAFKAECDKFFDQVDVGNVVILSKGSVKPANRSFNTTTNEYEIALTAESVLETTMDDPSVPIHVHYNFIDISALEKTSPNTLVDVIGVVHEALPPTDITTRRGDTVTKRDLSLVDMSGITVRLTLWGTDTSVDVDSKPILAIKAVRVGDFNGRSLSTVEDSRMDLNPAHVDKTQVLRNWYDSLPSYEFSTFKSSGLSMQGTQTEFFFIANAQPTDEKGLYFYDDVVITRIDQDKAIYRSCISDGCQKKVVDSGNGLYNCDKCQKQDERFKYRFMVQAEVCDAITRQYVTIFNDQAEQLFGVSAEFAGQLRDSEDTAAYCKLFSSALFKRVRVKMRAKIDTFNNEQRLRYVVLGIVDGDHHKLFGSSLIESIKRNLECLGSHI